VISLGPNTLNQKKLLKFNLYSVSKTLLTLLNIVFTRLLGKRLILPSKLAKGTEASVFINNVLSDVKNAIYLEIGVKNGSTFEAVKSKVKVGVDPYPKYFSLNLRKLESWRCTSDNYFENHCNRLFDVIYLDGLHHFDQTWRDLQNSLRYIKPSGIILIDDIIQKDKFSGLTPQQFALESRFLSSGSSDSAWNGDIYKIGLLLSKLPENFVFRVIDFGNNPRAILLCSNYNWRSFPIFSSEIIKEADDALPESLFNFQDSKVSIPELFRPISAEEALRMARNHMQGFGSKKIG